VFSAIRVHIERSDYEYPDSKGAGVPSLERGSSLRLKIGDGYGETQVEGLEVVVDGTPELIVGSAGSPQQWAFNHQATKPDFQHRYVVELRYRGASYSTTVEGSSEVVRRPAPGEEFETTEPVPVEASAASPWSVTDTTTYASDGAGHCAVQYPPTLDQGHLVPAAISAEYRAYASTPCVGEVAIEWTRDVSVANAPFADGVIPVTSTSKQLRRFTVR